MRRLATITIATLLSLILYVNAFVITKDGYFYDNDAKQSFVPRGISYQTFVQDIGQWITYAQIDYDLREMKKANINSIRVDFAWRDIENDGEGVYDWDRFDFLVNICEQYNMKIFPLIGYQWPPSWFEGGMDVGKAVADDEHDKAGWYSLHPPSPAPGIDVLPETFIYDTYWISDVMSFVHPKSIEKYKNFLAAVTGRYKNSKAIAGWVAGNEYGYLGLWSFRYDGYEPVAQEDFRKYLRNLYNNDINQLNQVWGSKHTNFEQIIIPPDYSRESQAWGDATQWRKNAVSEFIAKGSEAVAKADPNHLRSYSMVGMIFGGVDNMFHCEDPMTIVRHCRDSGYPLHFWSINNYPSSYPGNELRSGTFGIEYAKGTGVPVLYTETGSSSTDAGYIGFDDPEVRMGALLRNNVWEAYLNGVVGVHIFTWPDRDYITIREYGFGILKRYREPKKCYQYILEMFYQIALIEQHTPQLLTSLKFAAYDVAFFWPSHTTDQMFNRYQNNMAGVWGPLTRLGLRSRFMNETQLLAGDYKNIKLLILPRNQRMNPGELQFIHDNVLPAGVHVYSEADLPGMEDYHIRRHADFEPLMDAIFGLKPKVINAYNDNPVAYNIHMTPYVTVELLPTISMAPMRAYESTWFGTWKYHVVEPTQGGQVLVNMLVNQTLGPYPAIIQKKHASASAIAAAFALGDTNCEALKCWIGHYVYYKGLFLSPQGLNLPTSIGIEGSPMVQAFLIDTYDEMKILYIHNWDDYSYTSGVQLTVPSIIGMTVKDMLNNRRVVSESCSGVLTFDLAPNDLRILLINEPLKPFVSFVYNQTEVDIHPNLRGSKITVKFDTSKSREKCTLRVRLLAEGSNKVFARVATQVQGVGWTTTRVPIVDFSPFDKGYQSTSQGRDYYYEASISCPGMETSSSTINVMVSWPVAPKSIASSVTANTPVTTTISWENFPIARLNAFQGVVAIWNSTKTQKQDPTHYAKVARVASILESIGYTYSRMVAWDEGLQDYGPLYHVYNDTIPTDTTGKGNLDPKYFAELIKFLILPGVTVMNDQEVNNVRAWATCSNFTDMTLISIDGMPGIYNERGELKPDRFTDIFGTTNAYVPGGSSGKLTVTDANHPITQSVGANTFDITPGTFAAAAVANGGIAYGSITSNTGTYPAIITKQITNEQKAIVLNFDATVDNKVFPTKTFWTYVSKWSHLNSLIYKLRWAATCQGNTIGTTDAWIMQGTGSMGVTVTPTETCPEVVWKGWVYYWNQTNPADLDVNKGYYTSENDMKFIPNSVAKIGIGYALAIVFATMMLLL